jgi:hypothetical protein
MKHYYTSILSALFLVTSASAASVNGTLMSVYSGGMRPPPQDVTISIQAIGFSTTVKSDNNGGGYTVTLPASCPIGAGICVSTVTGCPITNRDTSWLFYDGNDQTAKL